MAVFRALRFAVIMEYSSVGSRKYVRIVAGFFPGSDRGVAVQEKGRASAL